jgi:hypothetical protein
MKPTIERTGTPAVGCSALLGRFINGNGKWVSLKKSRNGKYRLIEDKLLVRSSRHSTKCTLKNTFDFGRHDKLNILILGVSLKNILLALTPITLGLNLNNLTVRKKHAKDFHKCVNRPNVHELSQTRHSDAAV